MFPVVCFLYKIIPNPTEKIFAVEKKKKAQNADLKPPVIFLGLGQLVGCIIIFLCSPTLSNVFEFYATTKRNVYVTTSETNSVPGYINTFGHDLARAWPCPGI